MSMYNKMFLFALVLFSGCSDSCFDLAMKGDYLTLEKMLLNEPKIIYSKDTLGKNLLHYAVCSGSKKTMELLYRYGIDMNVQDKTGMTPLHVCAMWDLKGPARWLVQHGADIKKKDKFGDTVLHTSAVFGAVSVGKYFLEIGLSNDEKNNQGFTAMQLANEYRNSDWLRELVKDNNEQ